MHMFTSAVKRLLQFFAPQFSGGGGGAQTSTTTVQNYTPAEMPYRMGVLRGAKNLYQKHNIADAPYPGVKPIPYSPLTKEAFAYTTDMARGPATNIASELGEATQFGLSDVLHPSSNPYLRQAINTAIRPVTQEFTGPGGALQMVRDQATDTGGFNTRSDIAGGIATRGYLDTIGDISSNMSIENYLKGLDTMSRTMALAPQTMQTMYQPATALASVGAAKEAMQGQNAQYAADTRLWKLNAPWLELQNYANLVHGGGSSGSTAMTTAPSTSSSPVMSGLSGAAMGASIGSVFPGIGTAVGAGLGLMLGLFAS